MEKIFDYWYARGLRANHITLSRLFFAVFVVCFWALGFQTLSFIAIAIMWITDWLDGAFARGRDETLSGRLLDRFVDKIVLVFILVSAYFLSILNITTLNYFFQCFLYFLVIIISLFETWGILLVYYQHRYENNSSNNGAKSVGKFKLVAEVVFSMVIFCPDSLVDLVLYILSSINIQQLLIFKVVFLLCYGIVASCLTYYSFDQHASNLQKGNHFYKLSVKWIIYITVAIVVSYFLFFR